MKKKVLTRVNVLLGAAIFALLGMSSCERMVKYGPAPDEDVYVKYGVPDPEVVPEYGVEMPIMEENV